MTIISSRPVAVGEGAGFVDFIVRLDAASSSEVRVSYQLDNGSALYNNNQDFIYQQGTLVFAPGETSKTIRATIADGAVAESDELFWLDLYSPVGAVVERRYTPALIVDNDRTAGSAALSVSAPVVDEAGRSASFFVSLNRVSASPVSVSYSTADGTARAGEDFRASSGLLSFAPGEVVKTVTVELVDDAQTEADEVFQLVLSNASGAQLAGGGAGTATIGRNDAAATSTPYVTTRPVAASEGSAGIGFVVQLSAPSVNEVRLTFQTDNGSALYNNNQDFAYLSDTLVFAPGETTKLINTWLGDGTSAEPTEVLWLDLYNPVNAVVQQRYTASLIFDNDGATGTPAVNVSDVIVDESAQSASFFVWLSRPSVSTVGVGFTTAAGTAAAGSDFAPASGSLSFAPGEMVKTVTIDISDDDANEADELFQLVLSNPSNATLGNASGSATIGRSDAPAEGRPAVSATPIVVGEGQTQASFLVQLSAPSPQEVRVTFQTDNGSALYNNNQDFAYHSQTLIFAPGQTTQVVSIWVGNDSAVEPAEVFWLDLYNPVNATVPQRYTPGLLIDNDASSGTPGVSVRDVIVDESAQAARFFVTLDRPSNTAVTLAWTTVDDSARGGDDFAAASGTLVFQPGEVARTISVDLRNDSATEADEFFQLLLSNPSGATLSKPAGVALIGRNDGEIASQPYIVATPLAVGEGEAWAQFQLQLSAPSGNTVSVTYQVDNGSALYNNNQDFFYLSETLQFAPGETTRIITVPIGDGSAAEATEVFWLDLYNPVNATVLERYTPALVVDNDGTTGTPAISISDAVVNEGANTARFFVSLSRPSTQPVTVAWSTGDDTARSGSDYVAATGTLRFLPGEVVKTVIVPVIDDSLAETEEAFALLLSNATNATLADSVGAAIIGASDTRNVAQPQISAQPITTSEADTFATWLVRLNAPSASEARVTFQTDNGTALYNNNQDYFYQSQTLVFAPGETLKAVRVLQSNDSVSESTEGFTLGLGSVVGGVVSQRNIAATVLDNDGAGSVFSHGLSNDVYTITGALDRIAESVRGGIDLVRSSISYTLPEQVENMVLTGSAANAIGNSGNNVLRGNAANNVFDGREGVDTVVFSGPEAAYTVAGTVVQRSVASVADGNDSLLSIERLQFSDVIRASDTTPGGNVYAAYAMFNAGFNRAPTVAELSLWTAQLDRLGDTVALAQAMINYYAPGVPDEALVAHLWSTIVQTPIPLDALATYTGLVVNGTYTQASLLEFVSRLDLNTVELVGMVGSTQTLDPAFFPFPP